MTPTGGRVDAYLDHLLAELRLEPRRTRRVLAEAEDHLREAVAKEVAAGATPEEAEVRAIARFGLPRMVARRFAAEEGRLLPPSVLLHLAIALAVLVGVGLAAIGVSGVAAAGLGALFGKDFIAGDPPGITYTPARCADFLEYHPEAGSCTAAAVAHHFDEVVGYRVGAGVLGALLLLAYAMVRRRYRFRAGVRVLPDGFVATIGAALFGMAAALLLGTGAMQLVFTGGGGAGGQLTGGVASAVMFALFAGSLLRTLRAGAGFAGPAAG